MMPRFRSVFGPLLVATLLTGTACATAAASAQPTDTATVSSIGSREMGPLMNAWLQALHQQQPGITQGPRWQHVGDAAAIGALMFELADVAPMTRPPLPAELAPYAHQFAGDMMKTPVLVRVAQHCPACRLSLL